MSAEEEYNKSSNYKPPPGYEPWKIRNDYPTKSKEKPEWLKINFLEDPRAYSEAVKQYILEGNVGNNFIVQKNLVRDWYHPVWLHYGERGREPINGLRFTGETEAKYISENQHHSAQRWSCSYFNAPAATVLGNLWTDHSNPKWDKNIEFPIGSIIFQNIFCHISEDEVYTLKGSPTADACIAMVDPSGKANPKVRKDAADTLRLIQTDFAARDDRFPGLGWVFGTFMYDGTKANDNNNPWDNLIPIGIQWGNDPTLTQKAHDDGKLSKECWINGHALDLFQSLKGNRPWLGWHGRLDGVIDTFMSTCTSCHATVQLTPAGKPHTPMFPEPQKIPKGAGPGIFVQKDESAIARWFRNVPAGKPFDEGYLSADYNWHVLHGYQNYLEWRKTHPPPPAHGHA